jgi:hypothetical protein
MRVGLIFLEIHLETYCRMRSTNCFTIISYIFFNLTNSTNKVMLCILGKMRGRFKKSRKRIFDPFWSDFPKVLTSLAWLNIRISKTKKIQNFERKKIMCKILRMTIITTSSILQISIKHIYYKKNKKNV